MNEAQFAAAQDKLDALARSTRKGTPQEKESFLRANSAWEAAVAMPVRTASQREERRVAIEAVAFAYGLVAL